jgi:type II secretory pathway component GspD/PulD (secretin)
MMGAVTDSKDSRVQAEQEKTKAKIQIETRILTVNEKFLRDIGLDANSISDPNAWQGPKPITFWSSDSFRTYNLILDDLNVSFLLKTAQAHKDTIALIAPRVTVRDGETAELRITNEFNYISGYSEPNRPSDHPVPKDDSVELGKFIKVKPLLTPDKKNIHLDFELNIRELQGVEEHKYKGKYPYHVPEIAVHTTSIQCLVPDGKTLLKAGPKIMQDVRRASSVPMLDDLPLIGTPFNNSDTITEQRTLLIMVTPSIDIKVPPTPQSLVDPNDPLIKQLEEKFGSSDEQK